MEDVIAMERPDAPALYLLVLGSVPGLWLWPRLLVLMRLLIAHNHHGSFVFSKCGGTQKVWRGLSGGKTGH